VESSISCFEEENESTEEYDSVLPHKEFNLNDTDDAISRMFHMKPVHSIAIGKCIGIRDEARGEQSQEVRASASAPQLKARIIASGDESNQVKIWNSLTGTQYFHESGHNDTVISCGFSFDGEYLASAAMDGTVQIRQMTGLVACTPSLEDDGENDDNDDAKQERGSLKNKAFPPPQGLPLSSPSSSSLSPSTTTRMLTGMAEINWLSWHPKGYFLAVGDIDGNIWLWDARKGECVSILPGSAGSTTGGWSSDGRFLIGGYANGEVLVWSPRSVQILHRFSNAVGAGKRPSLLHFGFAMDEVTCLRCHNGENVFLVGSKNGNVFLCNANTGDVLGRMPSHNGSVELLDFVDEGCNVVATGGTDGIARVYDIQEHFVCGEYRHPEAVTCGLTYRASDGERVRNLLFTGCSDGLTRVWGIDDAACLKELNGISACVLCIKGKGNWIVAGGDDHTAVAFAIS